MSWATIREALQTRLAAIDGVENVHDYLRYRKKGWQDSEFQDLFMVTVGGNPFPHCWMFSRVDVAYIQAPEPDNVVKVQHQILVGAKYGFSDSDESEHAFNTLLDTVCADLINGDRTLGGVAITHSLPQVSDIQPAGFFKTKFLCHEATLQFAIEELLTDE